MHRLADQLPYLQQLRSLRLVPEDAASEDDSEAGDAALSVAGLCIYVYVYIAYVCMCIRVYTYVFFVYVWMHIRVYMYVYIVYVCVYVCIYVCMYGCMYV